LNETEQSVTQNTPEIDPLEQVKQLRLRQLRACAIKQKAEMESMIYDLSKNSTIKEEFKE
jgi:hypothetical protein